MAHLYLMQCWLQSTPTMEHLSNLAILEYNGKELWNEVNPLIEPIDAFQAVVKKTGSKRRRR